MPDWVGQEATRSARRANLYDYLMARHPNEIILEGDSLRLRDNHSVSVKAGYAGYTDFSDGSTGNSIDFLTRFLGYDFREAVTALCEFIGIDPAAVPDSIDLAHLGAPAPRTLATSLETAPAAVSRPPPKPRVLQPPRPFSGPYRALFAYLNKTRGIPVHMIQRLVDMGVLYQEGDSGHNNAVFIDPARTFCEVRGTYSGVPFHQVQFSDPDAFWWFKPRSLNDDPIRAYICEASIDAISLYLLLAVSQAGWADRCLFCSIGGVANQNRINAIKASMATANRETIIAVDNDEAGEKCRQRNPDCKAVIPSLKDWNADLLNYEQVYCNGQPQEWIGQLPQ